MSSKEGPAAIGTHSRPAEDIEEETGRDHEVPLRAGSGTLAGTARVPLISPRPDPDRARAVAKDLDRPL